MRLQLRHPLYSNNNESNDGVDIAIHEGDEDDLRYAVTHGWEVKTSVVIPVPDSNDRFVEIITLQRTNLYPNFGQKTFSYEYL